MSGRRRATAAELAGRATALLVAAGCFGLIAWSVREQPEPPSRPAALAGRAQSEAPALVRVQATAAGRDACAAQKEAEIAAIRAQGEINAERRMRIRQIEARACE